MLKWSIIFRFTRSKLYIKTFAPNCTPKIKRFCIQRLLNEREGQFEKLREEMKFYQLELINREQNYNTMFSANPTVGLLDPFGSSNHTQLHTRSSKSSSMGPVAKHHGPRPSRFSDHFVRIDPALLADQLPPNRLEPISKKKSVLNTSWITFV